MALSEEEKQEIRNIVSTELNDFFGIDKYFFQKHSQWFDGRNVQLGKITGSTIGTAVDQKLSVFNATPVVQGTAITDPSGGATQDAEARTAINALIDKLQAFGIIA